MRELLAHGELLSVCANAVALPQSFGDDGDFAHASDHIRDCSLHRVVINKSAHNQRHDSQ